MADVNKRITIEAVLIDNFSKRMKMLREETANFQRVTSEWQRGFSALGNQVLKNQKQQEQFWNSNRIGHMGFRRIMAMGLQDWRTWNQQGAQNTTRLGKFANGVRMATHGMRGFRMEMLGVMFFGMMMQKFFMGLLQPAMQMAGVMDLLSTILGVMFLPVALQMLDWIIKLYGWWETLSPATQTFIQWMVVLGVALGGLLYLIGTFALGIGSIIIAFGSIGGIGAIFSGLVAIITASAGLILAIFAIIAVAIVGFVLAWKENFGGMRDWVKVVWEGIKNIISGALNIIKGLFMIFWSLFKGDPNGIWTAIKLVWDGIVKIITGAIQGIVGSFAAIGLSLFRVLKGAWDSLWGFIKTMGSNISNWFVGLLPSFVRKAFGIKLLDDFVISGGQVYKTNPQDTIVGSKSGFGGGSINFSPVYNISGVSDTLGVRTIVERTNRSTVDELSRMMRTRNLTI